MKLRYRIYNRASLKYLGFGLGFTAGEAEREWRRLSGQVDDVVAIR